MPSSHANHAAVVAAGYSFTDVDYGATAVAAQRFYCVYEKPIVGQNGQSGGVLRATGFGSSQANARTAAVASLNEQRKHRYGDAAAGGSLGSTGGAALTVDVS